MERSSRTPSPPADLGAFDHPILEIIATPTQADAPAGIDLTDDRAVARGFTPAITNHQTSTQTSTQTTQTMALHALGLPPMLVTPALLASIAEHGPHAAFTWLFRQRIPSAPSAPNDAGQVLLILGPGEEALRGARQMARLVGVDPGTILFTTATPGLAERVTRWQRVQTVSEATTWAMEAKEGRTPVIVAVDAPLGPMNTVANQMIQAWDPDGVWAVVDATRRACDLARWLAGFTIVDALIGHTVETSSVPGALLSSGIPVALLDGRAATPKRWASLLCERLAGEDE